MAISISSFTKQLSLYAAVLFFLHLMTAWLLPERYVADFYVGFVPFFYLVTLGSKYVLFRFSGRGSKNFSGTFLSVNMIRFGLYVAIMLMYAFSRPEEAVVFAITFLVFYFAFTLFEVIFLYRDLK